MLDGQGCVRSSKEEMSQLAASLSMVVIVYARWSGLCEEQ